MALRIWTATALSLALAACGSGVPNGTSSEAAATGSDWATDGATDAPAAANLQMGDGKPAGTATITAAPDGVILSLRVEGLPPGEHGVHVHTTGKCEAPKFTSAGSHFNPGNRQHGLENAKGQHGGDMPNLTIGADGRGKITYTLKGAAMASLLDADGAAIVVHAKADDQKTDPSGDSGDRIACGVFSVG